MRNLVYLVAVSLDGFIADTSGDASVFPLAPATLSAIFAAYPETCPAHLRDDLGVDAAPHRFDAVLLGARTHQPAIDAGLTSGYPHLAQYVFTHRDDLPADDTVTVVSGDAVVAVRELKARRGRDIWLCGGGGLAAQLAGEIDELHLKINPVVLGDGVPLFRGLARPLETERIDSLPLPGGVRLERMRVRR